MEGVEDADALNATTLEALFVVIDTAGNTLLADLGA